MTVYPLDAHVLYECGICSCYHPWTWDGDCRDNANRFGDPEEYAANLGIDPSLVDVRSMEERIAADFDGSVTEFLDS